MTENGASQEDFYTEYDSIAQVEYEVRAEKNIIIFKTQEWKAIKKEEKVKEAEGRRRQERKDYGDARDQRMQDFMQRILAAQASSPATTSTTTATILAQTTRLPKRQIKPFNPLSPRTKPVVGSSSILGWTLMMKS